MMIFFYKIFCDSASFIEKTLSQAKKEKMKLIEDMLKIKNEIINNKNILLSNLQLTEKQYEAISFYLIMWLNYQFYRNNDVYNRIKAKFDMNFEGDIDGAYNCLILFYRIILSTKINSQIKMALLDFCTVMFQFILEKDFNFYQSAEQIESKKKAIPT